jgi:hypothetical protein
MIGKVPEKFCKCLPKIVLSHAKNPFTDRLIMVGDASITRIFKNGLESAYITSQLAARAAFENGISKEALTSITINLPINYLLWIINLEQ